MIKDSILNRIQFEIGIRFDMMPPDDIGWKKWAFDPFFGLTLPRRVLTNPREQVPRLLYPWINHEEIPQPEGHPKKWKLTSRCFWLHGGCRVLGLDVGFGILWRKKIGEDQTND